MYFLAHLFLLVFGRAHRYAGAPSSTLMWLVRLRIMVARPIARAGSAWSARRRP